MQTVSHIKTNGNNDRYGSNIVIMYSVFFLSGFKEKESGQSSKDSSEDDSETRSQEINKEEVRRLT